MLRHAERLGVGRRRPLGGWHQARLVLRQRRDVVVAGARILDDGEAVEGLEDGCVLVSPSSDADLCPVGIIEAVKTIQAFSARLRDEVDLDTLSAELLAVVEQTMQPTRASLWLRPAGSSARLS